MPLSYVKAGRPSNEQAVHIGSLDELTEYGLATFELPSEFAVQEALDYWTEFMDTSVFDDRSDLVQFGRTARSILEQLTYMREEVEEAFTLVDGTDREHLAVEAQMILQQQMAAIMGFTELIRVPEVEAFLRDPRIATEEGNGDIAVDLSMPEHGKAGLHVDARVLAHLRLQEPEPYAPIWYEDERVYVRVQRPVDMSVAAEHGWLRDVGTLQDFAISSLVGRVKTAQWRKQQPA